VSVMAVAHSIGLIGEDGGVVSGTIDEDVVLAALSDLATECPGNDDLFDDIAARVRLARSAGVVQPDAKSLVPHARGGRTLQLRYRSEMGELFADLAIDVGLRDAERLVDSPM
jgi:hypothetical protein